MAHSGWLSRCLVLGLSNMLPPDASPCLSLAVSSLLEKGVFLTLCWDISDNQVKGLRKAQDLLLVDLWSLSDLVTETETGSQPLVKAKPIQHRKDKPWENLQTLLHALELNSDFDLPLNLQLALMVMSGLTLGQTLQPKFQIACGQDNYKHHHRDLWDTEM